MTDQSTLYNPATTYIPKNKPLDSSESETEVSSQREFAYYKGRGNKNNMKRYNRSYAYDRPEDNDRYLDTNINYYSDFRSSRRQPVRRGKSFHSRRTMSMRLPKNYDLMKTPMMPPRRSSKFIGPKSEPVSPNMRNKRPLIYGNEKIPRSNYNNIFEARPFEDGIEDELDEVARRCRLKRMIVIAAYSVLALIVVLGGILTGYFLAPRTPSINLHSVGVQSVPRKEILVGTRMQFRFNMVYRVQNDNYFDMTVDEVSASIFWPETKFILGSERLINIPIPARRTAEITIPIVIRYDVKHGPPQILIGLTEACGLHDSGVGEINVDTEVQVSFHTKMKNGIIQTGRQGVSARCPVRRMGDLQIEGGGSVGNIGDIVRTLSIL